MKKKIKRRRMPRTIGGLKKLAREIYVQQFDEDTAPADIGDVIELLYSIVDYLEKMEAYKNE
jgi:hypothetical protein